MTRTLRAVVALLLASAAPAFATEPVIHGTSDINGNTAVFETPGTGPRGETTVKAQAVVIVDPETGLIASGGAGGGGDASAANQVLTNGYVDGLEGLITSTNGYVDGIETLLGTSNTNTAATATDVGPPGATACATDNGSCSLNALLQRNNQRLTTAIAGIPALPSSASGVAIAPTGTTANASSLVLCAAACNVYDFHVTPTSVAGYVILVNATSAPSNGAITGVLACTYVGTAPGTMGFSYGSLPLRASTGATLLFSTTGCHTLTLSATAEFFGRTQ